MRDLEGWFCARGCEGVEFGDVLEELGDENEAVQVEGDHGGDDVGSAPTPVAGDDGDEQDDQRENAELDAGGEAFPGEEESGDAGECGGEQEERGHLGQRSVREHTEGDEEAGGDGDEADGDVEVGVEVEAHAEDHLRFLSWGEMERLCGCVATTPMYRNE